MHIASYNIRDESAEKTKRKQQSYAFLSSSRHSVMNNKVNVSLVLIGRAMAVRHRIDNVGNEKAKENIGRFFLFFSTHLGEKGES